VTLISTYLNLSCPSGFSLGFKSQVFAIEFHFVHQYILRCHGQTSAISHFRTASHAIQEMVMKMAAVYWIPAAVNSWDHVAGLGQSALFRTAPLVTATIVMMNFGQLIYRCSGPEKN
jgi:hypothetical protein